MSEDIRAGLEAYYWHLDKDSQISDFEPISDGWETEIYAFTSTLWDQTEQMILRMYHGADASNKCEHEFDSMYLLWDYSNYPVPSVAFCKTDSTWLGKPFLIMERIIGHQLGDVMREDVARQSELLTRFVQLAVDLHNRDNMPFVWKEPEELQNNPSEWLPKLLRQRRSYVLDDLKQAWAASVFDWLDTHSSQAVDGMTRLSPLHGDFHPHNVLITPDEELYVIDWSGFSLGDYRSDLAWMLLLVSTSGYPQLRDLILNEYARLAGKPVEQIEYFDVLAALRRLVDFTVSVGSGAEAMGMRPETVAIMRERGDHYRQVYAILQNRTGLQIPEIQQLLDSLDSAH